VKLAARRVGASGRHRALIAPVEVAHRRDHRAAARIALSAMRAKLDGSAALVSLSRPPFPQPFYALLPFMVRKPADEQH